MSHTPILNVDIQIKNEHKNICVLPSKYRNCNQKQPKRKRSERGKIEKS